MARKYTKQQKLEKMHQLYKDLMAQGLVGSELVRAIVTNCPFEVSERTVWDRKKQWDVDSGVPQKLAKKQSVLIPKKPPVYTNAKAAKAISDAVKNLFHGNPEEIEWLDSNGEYTKEEIRKYVTIVCSEITIGSKDIMKVLDSKGITLFLWNKWISSDEELSVLYQNAKDQQLLSYNHRIQGAMKNLVMAYLSFEEIEEVVIEYEFYEEVDENNPNKMIQKERPVRKLVKRRPQKPDTTTIKMVQDMVREIQRKADSIDDDIKELMQMNEYQLDKYINELEQERNKRENATGETNTSATGETHENSESYDVEPPETV